MNVLSTLFRHVDRRRAYADLLALDAHLLRDIGVSRADLRGMMRGRNGAHRLSAHE